MNNGQRMITSAVLLSIRQRLNGTIHASWRLGLTLSVILAVGILHRGAHSQCEVAQLMGPNNKSGGDFGRSVSVTRDFAVVGDPGPYPGIGVANVFRYDGKHWVQEAELRSPEPDLFDVFGFAVAMSGDVVVVGAPGSSAPEFQSGAAHIFRSDGARWTYEARLTASDADCGDIFGWSVSVQGDVALIGARDDENEGLPLSGSAYLFRYNPERRSWVEEAKLTGSNPAVYELFGSSVAVSGDVAIIGAPGCESAVVFRYDGLRWSEEAELTAFDGSPDDRFGSAVSISGELVAIGAPHDDAQTGSVYVFRYGGKQWASEIKLMASRPVGPFPFFGRSLCIGTNASVLVVGAPNDFALGSESGAAYVFRYDGSMWREAMKLTASDGGPFEKFGASVSLRHDVALLGAHGGGSGLGTAYVIVGLSGVDCNENGTSDACEIFNGTSEDLNGNSIPDECECAADLNGDGGVEMADLQMLIDQWRTNPGAPPDFDGDGVVAVPDLLTLLAAWGPCQ